MRGTLKLVTTATNLVATLLIGACVGHTVSQVGVAKQDVLPGFTQAECRYKENTGPQSDGAGGGLGRGMEGAVVDKGGRQHIVECHHIEDVAPRPPTSGEPRAICSGPDGLLSICDMDWS
jgi:hypothetical protein